MPRGRVLRDELEAIRKGRGIQEPQVRSRMGPALRRLCRVEPNTSHGDARRALMTLLTAASDHLPAELRLAARVMFAIDDSYTQRFLRQRYEALAERWKCDFRTVQRRAQEVLDLIVERFGEYEETAQPTPVPADVVDVHGWYLERLGVVVLLNRPWPELIEERTLVCTVDGLARLAVALGVPATQRDHHPDLAGPRPEVEMDVVYGARLDSIERTSSNVVVQYLALPRPLRRGERHTYATTIRVPPGRPIAPRYVHRPVHRCDLFELCVKFDQAAPPRAVWVVSKIPELAFTDQRPDEGRVVPDSLGEVHVRFTDLQPHLGYGLAWLPRRGEHE